MTELDPFERDAEHQANQIIAESRERDQSEKADFIGRQYAETEFGPASTSNANDQRPPRKSSVIGKHKLEPKCMLKMKTS